MMEQGVEGACNQPETNFKKEHMKKMIQLNTIPGANQRSRKFVRIAANRIIGVKAQSLTKYTITGPYYVNLKIIFDSRKSPYQLGFTLAIIRELCDEWKKLGRR